MIGHDEGTNVCLSQADDGAGELQDPVVDHPGREVREWARDGSPFEEGARLEWVTLDEALARCADGRIRDLKTEIGLRRLRDELRG